MIIVNEDLDYGWQFPYDEIYLAPNEDMECVENQFYAQMMGWA